GWDENKSERATRENQERVRIALKIQEEAKAIGLENRIAMLNLTSLQEAEVLVEDSGEKIPVFLGKEDFGVRLQKALEVLDGRGKQIQSLISHGSYPIARFRTS